MMTKTVNYGKQSVSPNSSEEIESLHGTPETKLTAFSPEGMCTSATTRSMDRLRTSLPPAFPLAPLEQPKLLLNEVDASAATSQDPFVVGSGFLSAVQTPNGQPKLSARASDFTPCTFQENHYTQGPLGSANTLLLRPGRTQSFQVPRAHGSANDAAEQPVSIIPRIYPSLKPKGDQLSIEIVPAKIGQFSSDSKTSRSLIVSQIPGQTSANELEDFFNSETFSSLRSLVLTDMATLGRVYVNFLDIRDAYKAVAKAQSSQLQWKFQYISGKFVTNSHQNFSHPFVPLPPYCGQVVIQAEFGGPRSRFNAANIGRLMKDLLENYGELIAYEACQIKHPIVAYRAEYYNINSTESAVAYLNGFRVGDCAVLIRHYRPQQEASNHSTHNGNSPSISKSQKTTLETKLATLSLEDGLKFQHSDWLDSPVVSPVGCSVSNNSFLERNRDSFSVQSSSSGEQFISVFTPRSSGPSSPWSSIYSPYSDYGHQSPSWAAFTPGAIGQERGESTLSQIYPPHTSNPPKSTTGRPGGRNHDYSSIHHNFVDVERIRQGTDVRTTIMLRNIPNKIDQVMLKEIVDETSRGKYDFMYLRIDFANNCNVGYAFINFEDPYFIIDFVNARAGHRWNCFNSDKVAEVSYATIQGRDCLIQKFRNSSVMLEHPKFRPKIFHTGNSILAGIEDEFPGPDNPSKMRRSIENAEHIGLYAPRAGQNFRDEQRRRRSQYDRGTRLAEIEDSPFYDDPQYSLDHALAPQAVPSARCRGYNHSRHDTH